LWLHPEQSRMENGSSRSRQKPFSIFVIRPCCSFCE
jgi:hypothetical protein